MVEDTNGKSGHYTAAAFIAAIPGTGGIVSTIARKVGCSWHTAKKYCTEYATVAKVYQDECEGITDLAESTVLKAIRDGDVSAAKWYLTMKAKDRGYAPRQEITGADGGPVEMQDRTLDEGKRIRAANTFLDALTAGGGAVSAGGQDDLGAAEPPAVVGVAE